jgi:Tol biopolymer transport system component
VTTERFGSSGWRRAKAGSFILGLGLLASWPFATSVHAEQAQRSLSELAAPREEAGRIVFVSERDGRARVHSIRSDGSERTPLVDGPDAHYPGPIGPHGELLVVGAKERSERLALLRATTLHDLGVESGRARNPSWFPDGRAIAFESDRESFRDIYRLEVNGGAQGLRAQRLTRSTRGCFEPAVAPSGKHIAYTCSDSGDPEIYVMELATGTVSRLTWSSGEDSAPAWSPDGKTIAYLSVRRGVQRVYLMDADGSHPRPLRPRVDADVRAERDHAWSPDGKAIALSEQRETRAGIRVVGLDGRQMAQTSGAWVDAMPAWSPDGRQLAFSSDRMGHTDIVVMARDGSRSVQLTNDEEADWLPRWMPWVR